MRAGAIALYEEALHGQAAPLILRTADGLALPLQVSRWCGRPDAADEELLRHCLGPVLDVGCGPGRLTIALTERGIPALGVDISRTAVARVRQAGAPALHRSVFDPLPGQGRWATVLLADGNIGIGGQGHAIGHGCARPAPATSRKDRHKPDVPSGPDPPGGPRFTFTRADQPGPPGGYGTWRFSTGIPGQRDLLIEIGPLPTENCDHRHEARGHDPGVMLRHLTHVRYATCTGPTCRCPSSRADFEHNTPYEAGGRTCLCNGNPKCRFDHRLKQDPRWKTEQLPNGEIRWTTPSGRQYVTEPTRYPI
jgi:hypothetical protein